MTLKDQLAAANLNNAKLQRDIKELQTAISLTTFQRDEAIKLCEAGSNEISTFGKLLESQKNINAELRKTHKEQLTSIFHYIDAMDETPVLAHIKKIVKNWAYGTFYNLFPLLLFPAIAAFNFFKNKS